MLYTCHGVCADTDTQQVRVMGRDNIKLTASEFRILVRLMSKQGKIQTRRQLTKEITNDDSRERIVDGHIKRLRKKLFRSSEAAQLFIESVYGFGYRVPTHRQLVDRWAERQNSKGVPP